MSDENQVAEQPETQELDYKAMYEKAQADLDIVAAKKDQLYAETKKAKAEREKVLADAYRAQKAQEEKAERDGEFEKLWKTTKAQNEDLLNALKNLKDNNKNEKLQVAAMRISNDLADGDNAELLSTFVLKNLEKMADETGALSADVIESVTSEFKASTKFRALLRSSKAIGGGAPGNTRGAQEDSKILDRNSFEKLNPTKKMEFFKKGGTLTDS